MEIDASSINYIAPHSQATHPFSDSCLPRGRWAYAIRSGEVSGDSRAAPCDLHAGFHVEARSFRYAVVLEHAHQRLAQQIEISLGKASAFRPQLVQRIHCFSDAAEETFDELRARILQLEQEAEDERK